MNRAASLWLVAGLPGGVAIAIALKALTTSDVAGGGALLLVVIWIIGFFWLGFRVARFECPRCGGRYFSHTELYFGAGKHCGTCHLPLYGNH